MVSFDLPYTSINTYINTGVDTKRHTCQIVHLHQKGIHEKLASHKLRFCFEKKKKKKKKKHSIRPNAHAPNKLRIQHAKSSKLPIANTTTHTNPLLILAPPPPIQHPQTRPPQAPPTPSKHLLRPAAQLKHPPARNQHPAHHIHQPDEQRQIAAPLLRNRHHDRLNVVFDEDARHVVLVHVPTLLRHRVLVREDCVARGRGRRRERGRGYG